MTANKQIETRRSTLGNESVSTMKRTPIRPTTNAVGMK